MFRTANPALKAFQPAETWDDARAGLTAERSAASNTMTVFGTATKTLVLLGLCAATAVIAWSLILPATPGGGIGDPKVSPMALVFGGMIGGLILAIATIFKPRWSPVTAPLYAIVEGLFVGGVSALYAIMFATGEEGNLSPNYAMIMQAVLGTFGVLASMLLVYSTGLIKPGRKFYAGVTAATGGIVLVYLASWILGMFGVGVPMIHGSGPIGIGFSVFVIVIASLNLILDFDVISRGAAAGSPKHMEWFGAFALLVTLVWLYIEILHLLAKLQGRE